MVLFRMRISVDLQVNSGVHAHSMDLKEQEACLPGQHGVDEQLFCSSPGRSSFQAIVPQTVSLWFSGENAQTNLVSFIFCPWDSPTNKMALQRVTRTAEKVIGCPLPPLEHISSSRRLRGAKKSPDRLISPWSSLIQTVAIIDHRSHTAVKTVAVQEPSGS